MLDELKPLYDKLQLKYGDKNLDSIYNGGYTNNPDICFVFMNPTCRNIASSKEWHGLKSPWIGTKNIWNLFYKIGLLDEDIYKEIRQRTGPSWTEEFASCVYDDVIKHYQDEVKEFHDGNLNSKNVKVKLENRQN